MCVRVNKTTSEDAGAQGRGSRQASVARGDRAVFSCGRCRFVDTSRRVQCTRVPRRTTCSQGLDILPATSPQAEASAATPGLAIPRMEAPLRIVDRSTRSFCAHLFSLENILLCFLTVFSFRPPFSIFFPIPFPDASQLPVCSLLPEAPARPQTRRPPPPAYPRSNAVSEHGACVGCVGYLSPHQWRAKYDSAFTAVCV